MTWPWVGVHAIIMLVHAVSDLYLIMFSCIPVASLEPMQALFRVCVWGGGVGKRKGIGLGLGSRLTSDLQ